MQEFSFLYVLLEIAEFLKTAVVSFGWLFLIIGGLFYIQTGRWQMMNCGQICVIWPNLVMTFAQYGIAHTYEDINLGLYGKMFYETFAFLAIPVILIFALVRYIKLEMRENSAHTNEQQPLEVQSEGVEAVTINDRSSTPRKLNLD